MSKVVNWVDKTNHEIIELVLKGLEQNKSAVTIYNQVKGFELTDNEISIMVENDIKEVISKWNKYYEYGFIPIDEARYSKTSKLLKSRTSIVSQQLAMKASNSFANLNTQMFNLVERGSLSRAQAISILKKKYNGNTVMYSNGKQVPIDSYLNMVFRTELSGVTRERAFETGDYLDTTTYEMSSKVDSAERCVYAQGGYINFGYGDRTVSFKTSTGIRSFPVRDVVLHDGYGGADKLGGIGCRHTWVPRIEGFSNVSKNIKNSDYFTGL